MADYTIDDYHERSKHRPERYAPGPGRLDWANQPEPFRTFAGAERIELPLAADAVATRFGDLRRAALPPARRVDLESIGVLLELALGLSAWKSYGGASWALRCNPSSGNLHPTEGYVATVGVPGVSAGVYHYLSRDHVLELRGEWAVSPSLPGDGIIVGLSTIVWREAWKYGMRAFRYCQEDCGHAIAALAYAAAAIGWETRLLEQPGDAQIAAFLGLDRGEDFEGAEAEVPECLLWVGGGDPPHALPAAPMRWHGRANGLSAERVAWRDIDRVQEITGKPPGAESDAAPGRVDSPASGAPQADLTAATLIRRRRSAVQFDATTRLSSQTFAAMLQAALPSRAPPWNAWPWRAAVHLALFVHRVDGFEPGLYCLVRDPGALASLKNSMRPDWLWQQCGPPGLPLYLLIAVDLRDSARIICCHQDIAADSCFALGMVADFSCARNNAWRYRALHWECGAIGQVLYLEAEAAGIRATGIGCFFDDEMHSLLGLGTRSWQSLYHFTAGGPIEDLRLTTLPPYSFERARSAASVIR